MIRIHYEVLEAIRFAAAAHGDQPRKYTGEPYIVHPIAVCQTFCQFSDNVFGQQAAVLHDVVEDTDVTAQDIEAKFGTIVAALVLEVTNVSRPEDGNRAERKRIDRKHLSLASYLGQTIKLADIENNIDSIVQHDPKFARTYLAEKRELLPLLTHGNCALYDRVSYLINAYFHLNGEATCK